MSARRECGAAAEQAARAYLEDQGLQLLVANHRCRWGEIDLIMTDGDTLVFIEVRYRKSEQFGGAAASIDGRKRQRLCRAAADFMARRRRGTADSRFDVVALGPHGRIEWIRGAFDAGD